MRRRALFALLLPLLAAAPLIGGAGASAAPWPMYHLDPGRSGNDTTEPAFAGMHSAWNSATLDGAVYAEPLVNVNSVIVATEHDSLYAFDVASGSLQWGPVSLGTPRTSNFPCGDINPLGITGTPVIDGGFLYALAEVQLSANSFAFHLAKVDPGSGAVIYNVDVTPSGMDPNVEQERSALAVSAGNVVVTWGGLDGDCGTYHGYVETVSEASGTPQHQFNDTSESGGREGGIWGPSGPAVDAAGNIFVTTGNGSSTSISNYDYGDSVLKFSPALGLSSFFAPGSPQSWASLNADDSDLGSVGPALLPNGLLFAIGKGGRGYLLNQSGLPNSSNPGGGENFSAAVCHAGSDAAFGGLAVSGSTVYVPCADGVAAVSIDSASAFHTLWYQTSGGGSAPIVAGAVVWTLPMFGGSALYGLDPAGGGIATTLPLPATTTHFATPAAGDGMLFVAAGNRLAAFAPQFTVGRNVGAPQVTVTPDNSTQLVFWKSTASSQLTEAWYTGTWHGPIAFPQLGALASTPAVAVTKDGSTQLVFWEGPGGHLFEAWFAGSWNGPVDITAAYLGGHALMASAPTVTTTSDGSQLVFWKGGDGHLTEAWYAGGSWHGPADFTSLGAMASAPTSTITADGSTQLVFFQGSDGTLTEDWYTGAWHGPIKPVEGAVGSQPSVAVTPDGSTQIVFSRGSTGHLVESFYTGSWHGPADISAASFGNQGLLASAPSAAVTADGSTQLVFWQGAGTTLWEGWYAGGSWHGPVNWSG